MFMKYKAYILSTSFGGKIIPVLVDFITKYRLSFKTKNSEM